MRQNTVLCGNGLISELKRGKSKMKWNFFKSQFDIFTTISDGEYEALEITPLSSPPELPDVMKPQDSPSTHVQEQAAS